MIASLILLSCAKKEEPAKQVSTNGNEQQQDLSNNSVTVDVRSEVAKNVLPVGTVVPQKTKTPVDFSWKDSSGEKKFSELAKGKVVLVNFWGTWCPPCRAEIPDLIQISKDLKDKEFIMIGVALERNPEGAIQTVNSFVGKTGIPYLVFVDEQGQLATEYSKNFGAIDGVPTTYIFDKNAKLSQVIVGSKTKDEFMSYINKLL
jgi:thiol-disulfide isomerase/thioredoxin